MVENPIASGAGECYKSEMTLRDARPRMERAEREVERLCEGGSVSEAVCRGCGGELHEVRAASDGLCWNKPDKTCFQMCLEWWAARLGCRSDDLEDHGVIRVTEHFRNFVPVAIDEWLENR